jgi:hypothetical protein
MEGAAWDAPGSPTGHYDKLIKCSSLVSSLFSKRNQQLHGALEFTSTVENKADEWLIELFLCLMHNWNGNET